MLLDQLGTVTSCDAVSQRFAGRSWLSWFVETEQQNDPETNGIVTPRLWVGNLYVAGDAATGGGPWAVIIDGDLVVDGDLDCSTSEYLVSTLIVTGDVRARNVRFASSARVGIEGHLHARGVIVGEYGDSGATLGAGSIEARLVALDRNTGISSDDQRIRGIVMGSPAWREFSPDLENEPARNQTVFAPDVLDGGYLNHPWEHVIRGHPLLQPEAERELRAAKGLLPLETLAALDDDGARDLVAAAAEAVARSERQSEPFELVVLADWLEQRGFPPVPHAELAHAVAGRGRLRRSIASEG